MKNKQEHNQLEYEDFSRPSMYGYAVLVVIFCIITALMLGALLVAGVYAIGGVVNG